MAKMIQKLKQFIRAFIVATRADFIYQIVDTIKFKCLGRKPPELMWKSLKRSPECRYDAAGVLLDDKLYIIGGFSDRPGTVLSTVNILDLKKEKWSKRLNLPANMATNHLAITSDGNRYIFSFSGQRGPRCHPAIADCFVLDTKTEEWGSLPSLPEARYSSSAQFWQGRLHVMGGSKPDRHTPALDHWSIGFKDGKALEDQWRNEVPIPRGGPHRASAIIDDKFYLFGGQEGDVVARPGDPNFHSARELTQDTTYADTYALKHGANQWERLADMPIQVSHTEFSIITIGTTAVVCGGQIERHPQTDIIRLTDVVQVYDTLTNKWKVVGHLPYRTKTPVIAYYNGWLFMTTGQRDRGVNDSRTGAFDNRLWKAKISPDIHLSF